MSSDLAKTVRVLLVSPLPPPASGIGTWTRLVRDAASQDERANLSIIDTAVRWRAIDSGYATRVLGGAAQAVLVLGVFAWRLLRHRPDVVHLCTSGGPALVKDWLLLSLCRKMRIPSVIHLHFGRVPEIRSSGGTEWSWLKRALRKASRVVVLDNATSEALDGHVEQQRLIKLPNPVNIADVERAIAKCSVDPGTITFVGQVLANKGTRELVESCALLRKSGVAVKLIIAGPCSEAFEYELTASAQRAAGGSCEWLQFLGSLDHTEALRCIGAAAVFCLPSYTEGFPNVIMEAMAASKPIVATSIGAVPEMLDVEGDACGVCVAAKNVPELTAALRELLHNPRAAEEMGRRAYNRCRGAYDISTVYGQLVELWRRTAWV